MSGVRLITETLILLAMLLCSATSLGSELCPPGEFKPEEFEIRWSRGGVFGVPHGVTLTLDGAGNAHVRTVRLTDKEHYRFKVPPETVTDVIASIYRMRFFDLQHAYAGYSVRLEADGFFRSYESVTEDADTTCVAVRLAECEHSVCFVWPRDAPGDIVGLAYRLEKLSDEGRTEENQVLSK